MGENGWNQDVEGVNKKRMCHRGMCIILSEKIAKSPHILSRKSLITYRNTFLIIMIKYRFARVNCQEPSYFVSQVFDNI